MNGEKNKARILPLVWLMITLGLWAHEVPQRQSPCLAIFFIEMEDFMCLACLDSFLDLCRNLPPEILRERTLVVLMDNAISEEISERRTKIVLKKLQALFSSNSLALSVCMDNSGLFQEIRGKADIVIFEPRLRDIKSFCFPLSRQEKKEVLDSMWS
jgi:hypothetical protein